MINTSPPPHTSSALHSPQMRSGEPGQSLSADPELSIGAFRTLEVSYARNFVSNDQTLSIVIDGIRDEVIGKAICAQAINVIQQILLKGRDEARTAGEFRMLINEALTAANSAIVRQIRDANGRSAGCSLVLAMRGDSTLIVKSVGDCRAYLLRGDSLRQLTHDHTLTQLLSGHGRIGSHLPGTRREVLLNCLGVHDFQANDEFVSFDLRKGDRVLLTNRGLTSLLSHGEIETRLCNSTTPTTASAMLGCTAVDRGAKSVSCVSIFAN